MTVSVGVLTSYENFHIQQLAHRVLAVWSQITSDISKLEHLTLDPTQVFKKPVFWPQFQFLLLPSIKSRHNLSPFYTQGCNS